MNGNNGVDTWRLYLKVKIQKRAHEMFLIDRKRVVLLSSEPRVASKNVKLCKLMVKEGEIGAETGARVLDLL